MKRVKSAGQRGAHVDIEEKLFLLPTKVTNVQIAVETNQLKFYQIEY